MAEKLTLVQRTILANQYRILAALGDDPKSNSTKAEILENGYTGKYYEALLNNEEISEEVCKETSDILQMYRIINNAYAKLPAEQQQELNMEVIEFEGFDGHEPHLHYASFMIEQLNLWREHKDKYLDSHTGATIEKYRDMLQVYNLRYCAPYYKLSFEAIKEIIDAIRN